MSRHVEAPFDQWTVSDPWSSTSTLPAFGVTKVVKELEDMRAFNLKFGSFIAQQPVAGEEAVVIEHAINTLESVERIIVEPTTSANSVST